MSPSITSVHLSLQSITRVNKKQCYVLKAARWAIYLFWQIVLIYKLVITKTAKFTSRWKVVFLWSSDCALGWINVNLYEKGDIFPRSNHLNLITTLIGLSFVWYAWLNLFSLIYWLSVFDWLIDGFSLWFRINNNLYHYLNICTHCKWKWEFCNVY